MLRNLRIAPSRAGSGRAASRAIARLHLSFFRRGLMLSYKLAYNSGTS